MDLSSQKIKSAKSKNLKTSIKFKGLKGLKSINKSLSVRSAPSLPGTVTSSSSSTVRKKDEGLYDLEQQFVLRLPPGPAMALRRDVQSAAMNLKDRLSIEIQPDMRHGRVTYGGHVFSAKLVDLPCIIESLKTTDRKTFYKTADICQMLICTMDDDSDSPEEEGPKKKDKEKEKKYQWNHGITPPLKNVRKRRFRKTLKKKYQEQPDIEKEVKRLFRMDNEAIDVKWEVVIEEEKKNNPDQTETQVLAQGGVSSMLDIEGMPGSSGALGDIGELDIFGELSSSDEEEEERDVNIMDSGDEENTNSMQHVDNMTLSLLDLNTETNASADGADGEGELHKKLEELIQQLDEIKAKHKAEEEQLSLMSDSDSKKEEVQSRLNELLEEENKKQNEYEILSSMLINQG